VAASVIFAAGVFLQQHQSILFKRNVAVSKHTAYHGGFSTISVDLPERVKLSTTNSYTQEVPSKWPLICLFSCTIISHYLPLFPRQNPDQILFAPHQPLFASPMRS
jgi:hypothetical protein